MGYLHRGERFQYDIWRSLDSRKEPGDAEVYNFKKGNGYLYYIALLNTYLSLSPNPVRAVLLLRPSFWHLSMCSASSRASLGECPMVFDPFLLTQDSEDMLTFLPPNLCFFKEKFDLVYVNVCWMT